MEDTRSVVEKKARPQEQMNCPRCSSTNTKFCYYNNYSLTQPRYFCKTCRRYWTEGGSLRNVPVGGGSRKNKKIISTSSKVPDLNPPSLSSDISSENPKMQDLNLAFPAAMERYHIHAMSPYVEMPKLEINGGDHSAVELLRSGMASRALNPYVSNSLLSASDSIYTPAGYHMQEIKPNLSFSIDDGFGNRSYGVQENGGGSRLLFPFGEIKAHQLSAGVEVEQNKEQGSNQTGYWTGIINGEGSSW